METLNQEVKVAVPLTPESSPERVLRRCERPMSTSLPYRLKVDAPGRSPQSSPDRDNGGVSLSPAVEHPPKWEGAFAKMSPTSTTERSLQDSTGEHSPPVSETRPSNHARGVINACFPPADKHSPDRRNAFSAERSAERCAVSGDGAGDTSHPGFAFQYDSNVAEASTARLPPRELPQHYSPDNSRDATTSEATLERPAMSGDGTALSSGPSLQENQAPSTAQEQPSLDPPAYQARPLARRQRRPNRTQRIIPSRSRRQRLWELLKLVAFDVIVLLLVLAVTGVILEWAPLWRRNERLFPVTFDPYTETWYGPRELSYPRHAFLIGVTLSAILIPLIPLTVILLMQYWIRSWVDFNAAFFALKKAMVLMLFIQIILKSYIGEFRPSFISVCDPDPSLLAALRAKTVPPTSLRVFADPTFCRGKSSDVTWAMTSFPSGHTASAFMAGTLLALYLNAKLKPFGDFHTSFWKMIVVISPIIGAMFVAGSLVADRNHHHHDILLSIPIGVIVGLLSYRTHYASMFDYHSNHLPLPWSGSNESLKPTVPRPDATHHGGAQHYLLSEKGNFAATTWPRKPKTYSYRDHRPTGNTEPVTQGFDGTIDRSLPAMPATIGSTTFHRLGGMKRRRTRLAMVPRQSQVHRLSVGSDSSPDSIPLADTSAERIVSRRMGVDSWAGANRESRSGRPSDIV